MEKQEQINQPLIKMKNQRLIDQLRKLIKYIDEMCSTGRLIGRANNKDYRHFGASSFIDRTLSDIQEECITAVDKLEDIHPSEKKVQKNGKTRTN